MVESEKINSKKTIQNVCCYCIEEIFQFLDEKLKLNIIHYNKELIKILQADINDYKKI